MTLYEKHLGRPSTKEDMLGEREWYVSRVLSKQEMDDRRKLMKTVKPKQLRLF